MNKSKDLLSLPYCYLLSLLEMLPHRLDFSLNLPKIEGRMCYDVEEYIRKIHQNNDNEL